MISISLCLLSALASLSWAPLPEATIGNVVEIKGPGAYSGSVVFDRFDGCLLHSGAYVTYISEEVKEALRPHAGTHVQVDASDVVQPMNPGEARIEAFTVGPALAAPADLDGFKLEARVDVNEAEQAVAVLTLHNQGTAKLSIDLRHLAPTLLTTKPQSWLLAPDGPSFAVLTGAGLAETSSAGIRRGGSRMAASKRVTWRNLDHSNLQKTLILPPLENRSIRIEFEVPDGQYDFLCGYEGRRVVDGGLQRFSFSSNLAAFDVQAGKAEVVRVAGRD